MVGIGIKVVGKCYMTKKTFEIGFRHGFTSLSKKNSYLYPNTDWY